MKLRYASILGGLALVAALLFGTVASTPSAQAEGSDDQARLAGLVPPFDHDPGFWLRESIINAAAKTIGIRPAEVRAGLLHGASLEEIGIRHGVRPPELKRGILFHESVYLYRLVDAGKLTRPEAARILNFLTEHIDEIVSYHPGS